MASALDRRVLHALHDQGPLSLAELARVAWPHAATDEWVIASFLAHCLDHGWVRAVPTTPVTFALTTEGQAQVLSPRVGVPA